MDLKQEIIFSESVFAQEVDGEMVLLDMNSENYFGLDEVGSAIWQAMQEKEKLQDVYDVMIEQYEVAPDVLENDLLEFAEKLRDSGLIKIK